MKSISLLLLALIATQAYANLLDGLEHHHDHGDHGHGDHGDHGAHGEHGDHGHGDHGEHGAHGEHDHHGEQHGDHGHGDHGEHGDHAEHGHQDHAEGDHQHDASHTPNNDAFANVLAADLGGGFLSSNPAPFNDLGSQPSNDLNQGFLQSNPAPTQAPVAPPRQDTTRNQGKQLFDNGPELGGPKYATVPQTSFRCEDQATGGYFADTEAECQVFHICMNGANLGSFLCPNGTLFHQQFFVCDWWFNVDCNVAPDSYSLNAAIGVVPEDN